MTDAAWLGPAVLTALLFVAGPLLAHLHLVPAFAGFLAFVASGPTGLLAIAVGAVRWFRRSRHGGSALGLVSIAIGLVPLIVLGVNAARGRGFPPINDIATNLDNPPVFVAAKNAPENAGKDLAYPEDFKEIVQTAYAGLISLQIPLPPDQAFKVAQRVAATRQDWRLTRIDPGTLTLEGEETGGLFQFTDDFVIRILPMDGSSQVDMRSRSRVGKGDLGANAARIRDYFLAVAAQPEASGPTK